MKHSKINRRVLILCINPYIRIEFQNYLQSLLGEYVSFDASEPSAITSPAQLKAYQCILFSSKKVQEEFSVSIPESIAQIICTRTFNHAFLDQIIRIPPNEKVYVVNDLMASTLVIIQEFQNFGITQYEFIPWAEESQKADPSVRYAITVGEPQLVPKHIRNVINIGNRIIDIATVNELCTLFQLPAELVNQITKNYISHILKVVKTAGNYYSSYIFTQQLLLATASNLPLSLCLLDEHGHILLLNKHFASDWELSEKNTARKSLALCLPEIFSRIPWDRTADYHLANPAGIPFILSVMELSFPNHTRVCMLISKKVTDIETGPLTDTFSLSGHKEAGSGELGLSPTIIDNTLENLIFNPTNSENTPDKTTAYPTYLGNPASASSRQDDRLTAAKNKNRPEEDSPIERQRNSFLDFITVSAQFQEILSYAKRMSLYDFPLLIQGEDGTQKKMLAYSIHKSSSRRNGPFVCLNQMLTLSGTPFPQILNAANQGTLLVDNIQRLSPEIQESLIQLLQSPFHNSKTCDTRIIATSSQNLYALTQEGRFRQDLFFQLSSAVIDTIPLKKRREDIPLLFQHFFQGMFHDPKFHNETILSKSLYQFLLHYDYPGNVQELINLAQYFYSMYAAHPLILSQLPSYIRSRLSPPENSQSALKREVLSIIKNNPRAGRAAIQKALAASGAEISDGKLRGLLKELSEENLILVHRTKGGCEITEAGLAALP